MGESALEAIESTNELLGDNARTTIEVKDDDDAINDEEIFNDVAQEDE